MTIKEHQSAPFAGGFVFLEGPRWHDGAVWVSDIFDGCVYRITPDAQPEVIVQLPSHLSGLGFLPDGTPLVVAMAERKILKIVNGKAELHADISAIATGDANDMIVDSNGCAYVGNLGYDMMAGEAFKPADIAFIDTDGSVKIAAEKAQFPNGMVFLDEERILVVAETWAQQLIAYDRQQDGTLSGRRIFAQTGERTPDGIAVDSENGIWLASFTTNEFVRILEGGEVTDRVSCPGRLTPACALGGPDGRTLFCLTFPGDLEDVQNLRRKALIETVRVDVPAHGYASSNRRIACSKSVLLD